jgi:hypothetical protein
MGRLFSLLEWCSARWWKVAVLGVFQGALLRTLFFLSQRLETLGVGPAFDVQNGLTVEELVRAAANYTSDAQKRYLAFLVVDCIFPPLASLFLAALALALLRFVFPNLRNSRRMWLVLAPFSVAVFDLLENVFLSAVVFGEAWSGPIPWLAIAAKRLKLATLLVTQLSVLGLIVAGFVLGIYRRFRKQKTPTSPR